jgi:hypothetical protein
MKDPRTHLQRSNSKCGWTGYERYLGDASIIVRGRSIGLSAIKSQTNPNTLYIYKKIISGKESKAVKAKNVIVTEAICAMVLLVLLVLKL